MLPLEILFQSTKAVHTAVIVGRSTTSEEFSLFVCITFIIKMFKKRMFVRCASSQPVHVPHVAEDSSRSPDTPVTASGGEFRTPAPYNSPSI